jgi:hypothetical protein
MNIIGFEDLTNAVAVGFYRECIVFHLVLLITLSKQCERKEYTSNSKKTIS